jgi:hypothetical protein
VAVAVGTGGARVGAGLRHRADFFFTMGTRAMDGRVASR